MIFEISRFINDFQKMMPLNLKSDFWYRLTQLNKIIYILYYVTVDRRQLGMVWKQLKNYIEISKTFF